MRPRRSAGLDVALHEELVHALVAARKHHIVEFGDLDVVDRVVDRGTHDL
jgi:hypothetical protein